MKSKAWEKVEESTLDVSSKDLCLQILTVMELSPSISSFVEFCDDGGVMLTCERESKEVVFVFPTHRPLAYIVAEWSQGDDEYLTNLTLDVKAAHILQAWLVSPDLSPPCLPNSLGSGSPEA